MTRENLIIKIFIVVVLALFILLVGWRVTDTVDITLRAWEVHRTIKWDERRCDYNGKNCTTDTHTRCTTYQTGTVLPPITPARPCAMQWGDYEKIETIYYILTADGRKLFFNGRLWNDLMPNTRRQVVKTLGGYITNMKGE